MSSLQKENRLGQLMIPSSSFARALAQLGLGCKNDLVLTSFFPKVFPEMLLQSGPLSP